MDKSQKKPNKISVVAEAKGPPNDDERTEIIQAEARKAWEELVSTVRGREFWGPEPLKQETPAEDDVLINNHTMVWGSYWKDHKWGFGCCKNFTKESFCQPPECNSDFPASTFSHEFTHQIQIGANTQMRKRRKSRGVKKEQETQIVAATACARFSPDGMHLASCCSFDAFIKIWDYSTGILKMSFQDQTEDDHLLCIEFSQDSKRLASGSKNGNIKLYNTITRELLSSSLDHKARIHDLGTLEMTKEFSGHSDSVNCAIYFSTDRILTASQDCTVKVWDPKTTTCLMTIEPALSLNKKRAPVNSIHMLPTELGKVLVCSKTSSLSIIDCFQGKLVRTLTSKVQGSAFIAACVSQKGNFIYAVGEDGMVYCFDYKTGELKHRLEVKGVSVSHHPCRNLIVTCSKTSSLKLWSGWRR
ncbi:suppressor of mec-8 and unc-52 protein homolog 1 isoform X2 [Arabidopsis lyrata subsp. lyrata]|uniref:suppressor of mec-8 and unc-52 protein homolog 1 isoform X2 n=1 Tax=Arabidopsis lyrata subsp. lyrata TaxID=81972 RepID=UPI000A29C0C6|nr:suppressor of mec-8 and unc-52 protein homolog 1 isoform X2 [Arabidopsis lyrata subsp. lyrata]|eukprot:XP_020877951.1 suppressor of mec-8 and unc-52 protein homolog 1 isoform X2 [Arabidopsis lyrata subsp. lyrata]